MRILFGLTVSACLFTVQTAYAQPTEAPQPPPSSPPQMQPQPMQPQPMQPMQPQPPMQPMQPQPPPQGWQQPPPAQPGAETPHPGPGPGPHARPHDGSGHGWMREHRRPWLGGLGWLFAGFMPGEFSAMQTVLGAPTVLGPGYDAAPMSVLLGGGGGGLIGPVWVGGKGYHLFGQTTPHGLADTSLGGNGGGGELGFAAVATDEWLVVPYVGVGGFGYSLSVTNKSPQAILLYPQETIAPGVQADYKASLWTGEFGLRVNRLVFWGGDGGMTVGGEIGYMSSLTRDAWTGVNTASPESAAIRGGYLKIVVGGGGFLFKGHPHDE